MICPRCNKERSMFRLRGKYGGICVSCANILKASDWDKKNPDKAKARKSRYQAKIDRPLLSKTVKKKLPVKIELKPIPKVKKKETITIRPSAKTITECPVYSEKLVKVIKPRTLEQLINDAKKSRGYK